MSFSEFNQIEQRPVYTTGGADKSVTATLTPIIAALVKAEDVLGAGRVWDCVNTMQDEFLNKAFTRRYELAEVLRQRSATDPLNLHSIASHDAAMINRFMAEHGYGIALEPFTSRDEFGTASIMSVLVQWMIPGSSTR